MRDRASTEDLITPCVSLLERLALDQVFTILIDFRLLHELKELQCSFVRLSIPLGSRSSLLWVCLSDERVICQLSLSSLVQVCIMVRMVHDHVIFLCF